MTKPLHIAIEPFKRSEFDRGSKKILVDGEEWGWIEMQSHGSNGPSYHVHDLHGPIAVGVKDGKYSKGDPILHRLKLQGAKSVRIANIGKPQSERIEPKPTTVQLQENIAQLIANGHLRSPAVRQKERKDIEARYQRSMDAHAEREAIAFKQRALAAIPTKATTILHDNLAEEDAVAILDEMRDAIVAAMKWAQTQ